MSKGLSYSVYITFSAENQKLDCGQQCETLKRIQAPVLVMAKLCSACLLGINCKWDGKSNKSSRAIALSKRELLIPVCPEQLGGLSTPREPMELRNGKAVNASGKDVTEQMKKGALETLRIAKLYKVKKAILKARSPSCGFGQLKLLSGDVVKGNGITAELLHKNRIKIISEEEI